MIPVETKQLQPRLRIGNWVCRLTSDGGVYYASDSDRGLGGIRIRERQRPLCPIKVLIDATLKRMSEHLDRIDARPVEPVVTEEGEYGALTTFVGTDKATGKPMLYVLAVVFGDEWYNRFDGWMSDPAQFDSFLVLAREAVEKHYLMLGRNRCRRFYYTPPAGWEALQRDLLTQWFPPGYPKHGSVISVPPAFTPGNIPSVVAEAIIIRRLLGFQTGSPAHVEYLKLNGLIGVLRHNVGHFKADDSKATDFLTASLVDKDKTYTYIVHLETTKEYLERDRSQMYVVLKSLRALPAPTMGSVNKDLQDMWVE